MTQLDPTYVTRRGIVLCNIWRKRQNAFFAIIFLRLKLKNKWLNAQNVKQLSIKSMLAIIVYQYMDIRLDTILQ